MAFVMIVNEFHPFLVSIDPGDDNGVSDKVESDRGLNPNQSDSNGDGLTDGLD